MDISYIFLITGCSKQRLESGPYDPHIDRVSAVSISVPDSIYPDPLVTGTDPNPDPSLFS